MPRLRTWLSHVERAARRKESGQIIVLFAVFLIVLMVLAGSAFDYASIVADDARLQNAVDASVLAGANSLSNNGALPAGTPVAIAQSTAQAYLAQNGVATATPGTNVRVAFPTSTPGPSGTPSTIIDNISIDVTRQHQTFFWPLVGLSSVLMHDGGAAHSSRGMVDVMLSLDTTYSEVATGTFPSIQQAVVSFINTMAPTTSDPRGPQIGIARFGGVMCDYRSDGSGIYDRNCRDDENVLSPLTQNPSTLLKIADGSGTGTCPTGDAAVGGCPLAHLYYQAANSNCTTNSRTHVTTCTPTSDYYTTSGSFTDYDPGATGTKLPNAISAVGLSPVSPYTTFTSSYSWSDAQGGRNDVTDGLNARKVLVLMTDGQDEIWPAAGTDSVTAYDTQVKAMATKLKLGPDLTASTADDVEIYVVGYFCTPYTPNATSLPAAWCQSQLADTTDAHGVHPCPGPTWPPTGVTPSSIDTILWQISSSSPGTCDHYFPLSKSQNLLPQLFSALAGRISRGQLTQ
jgi:Flp pilus assembly protein TadG